MAYHLVTNFHPTMLLLNLQLTDLQRHDPEHLTAISTLPAGVFRRTRALLLPDQGHTLASIARLLSVSLQSVATWRDRLGKKALAMLFDKPRSGRPIWPLGT